MARLERDHVFSRPIVTQVVPLVKFYPAEEYHQNYLARHPDQLYIVYNDLPKLAQLKERLPELRSEEHTSELQSQSNLVCRLLLDKKRAPLRLPLVPRNGCGRPGR